MDGTTERLTEATPLDAWLEKSEAIGEIKRITAEVDPDLETGTINYLAARNPACPALIFENIKGHKGYRALYNMMGASLKRFCIALDAEQIDHPLDAVRLLKDRMRKTIPPKEIAPEAATVNEVIVSGDDVDITKFPVPRPSEKRPYGSKALINACMEHRYLKEFSPRSKISKAAYEQVAARWNELGFPGKAPRVTAFEDKPFPATMPMPK